MVAAPAEAAPGIEAAWQPQVQRFALDTAPLATLRGRERQVVLNLVLRYAAVLRGGEVERIAAYLEREGFVAQALAELRSRRRWRRARWRPVATSER
ncbi:MAG: hypothetical protein ACLQUT_02290 [Thermoleophilia bacterium]